MFCTCEGLSPGPLAYSTSALMWDDEFHLIKPTKHPLTTQLSLVGSYELKMCHCVHVRGGEGTEVALPCNYNITKCASSNSVQCKN